MGPSSACFDQTLGFFQHHSDQCENDTSEPDNRQVGRALRPPPYGQPSKQHDEIEDPGNERPGLFGIPTYIGSARKLGRDSSRHNSQGKQGKPQYDRLLIEMIEKVERRELTVEDVE